MSSKLSSQNAPEVEEEGSGLVERNGGRWSLGVLLAYLEPVLWHALLVVELEYLAVGKSHCQETICYFELAETLEEENVFSC